jgi:hypothetical protein
MNPFPLSVLTDHRPDRQPAWSGDPIPWVQHIPVLSFNHIPWEEAHPLKHIRPGRCRPDEPSVIAHLHDDGSSTLIRIEEVSHDVAWMDYPVLRTLCELVAALGFDTLQLAAEGDTYDLPLFEW